uniref:ABC transmembrane type-1 domain-containing protein n=1 Tax=Panagrellus redivivus TaxID=6233 RepID=A0A7E4UR48_PANRE
MIAAMGVPLHCLKCGLLSLPTTSSTARTFCSIPRQSLLHRAAQLRIRRPTKAEFKRFVSNATSDKRPAIKLRDASWTEFMRLVRLAVPYKGRIGLGFVFLGLGSSIFLLTPHVLGKLIDEFDDSKKKREAAEQDKALKVARYFKEHPIALVALLVCGAGAICGRTYCMHTAGKCFFSTLNGVFTCEQLY